ncbi:hypothetical protein ACHAQJ_008307 [Trichoderma viride]
MPWTIWPALVVLWGVCWMFNSELVSSEAVEAEVPLLLDQPVQPLEAQEHWLEEYINTLPTTSSDDGAVASLWNIFRDTSTAAPDWRAMDQPTQIDMNLASPTTPLVAPASIGGEHACPTWPG